jgi:hypothetical protein
VNIVPVVGAANLNAQRAWVPERPHILRNIRTFANDFFRRLWHAVQICI